MPISSFGTVASSLLLSGVCADATDRCVADVGLHDVFFGALDALFG
jgi:hypothetical protein